MIVRIQGIDIRNRPGAIALAAVALAAGALLLTFGILLLIGVAAIGTVLGGGIMLFRAITGRRGHRLRTPDAPLDPALEVFVDEGPTQPASRDLASSRPREPD
jgi:hypothetical protein